jgi:hypothetical protein
VKISWSPPPPRKGLAGEWDKFIGPGATTAEIWLQMGAALFGGLGVVLYAALQGLDWNTWQYIVAAILAFDLCGGVVTNATSTAKRWYHRSEQDFARHMLFIAVHAVQIFLVAWLFRGLDWLYFAVIYGYLLVSAALVLRSPLYLHRPLAMLFWLGSLVPSFYIFAPTAGLGWFGPVLFLKLLVSHLLKEAPFRPEKHGVESGG